VLSVSSIYPVGLVVNGASPPGSKFTRAIVSSPAFPHQCIILYGKTYTPLLP